MKKMISRFILFSLIYLFFSTSSYSKIIATMPMAQSYCKNFMDDIVANYSESLSYDYEDVTYRLPFFVQKTWDPSKIVIDEDVKEKKESTGDWVFLRDENNYIQISTPAPPFIKPKFFRGDKIISINGQKVSDMNDAKLNEIFNNNYKKEDIGKTFKIEILRNKEKKLMDVKINEVVSNYYLLRILLNDLKLNVQESNITASINLKITAKFKDLKKFTDKHFVVDEESFGCEFNDEEINIMQLPRVDDYIKFLNSTIIDRESLTRGHQIDSIVGDDNAKIVTTTNKKVKINQNFQLKSFPFDKQVIKMQVIASQPFAHHSALLDIDHISEQKLLEFIDNINIPGWKIIDYSFNNNLYQSSTFYTDTYVPSLDLRIVVQRTYEFYLFKIILPILLILLICWSVLWIDPKELESRLTITVVCLLSLIAYNFVIEKDIPKLSYLTIMDYIILLSYIYATIPNFLSVASFKLRETNPELCNKIEYYGKNIGPLSYVLLVLFSILFAINNNPNTAEFLSGLI